MLLKCTDVVDGLPHLKFSQRRPKPGDEVIVMGYPTGLRAMLAQTGDDFLAGLQDDGSLDFWAVAGGASPHTSGAIAAAETGAGW